MRMASEITIRQINESRDDEEPKSEVLIEGKPTGIHVAGAVLEAAVQWQNCYLMLTVDDIPYEEMLRILLLDSKLRLVDSAMIGGPYATGSLASLQLIEPNIVRFRFIGDTVWSIELLSRPRFYLPLVSEPIGVWRSFSFCRRFVVRGNPHPQSA